MIARYLLGWMDFGVLSQRVPTFPPQRVAHWPGRAGKLDIEAGADLGEDEMIFPWISFLPQSFPSIPRCTRSCQVDALQLSSLSK